jgi:uncharacterized membrane protein YdjX (TVP38/TMEM64 family)
MMEEAGTGETWPAALRRWLPVAMLGAAVALFFALGLGRYLTFEALAANRAALSAWVARLGPAAPVVYSLLYGAITALSVPGAALLTMTGGFLFGTVPGALAALVGATSGATIVFLVARSSFGTLLERRAGPRLRKLEAGFRANAVSYLLVLRLVPLFPFSLVNIVAGLFGMQLATFVICSVVGMAPATFIFASLGAGLGAVFDRGQAPDSGVLLAPRVLLPLLGLAVLALLPVLVRWRRER